MSRILNTRQLGEQLGFSPRTVRTWVRNGWIPGRRVGRGYLLSEDALHQSLAVSTPTPTDEEERNAPTL